MANNPVSDYDDARAQLARDMAQLAISAELTYKCAQELKRVRGDVRDYPVSTDEDGWAHRAWRFDVTIAGETVWGNRPYRTGTGILTAPDATDLFAAILTDAGMAAPYDGMPFDDAWIACADDLGGFSPDVLESARNRKRHLSGVSESLAGHIKRQRDNYRECRAALELLRERLGEEVTADLIELATQL